MYFSEQTPGSSESSCQTVLRPHQQALLSHSEKPSGENDSQLGGLRHECNGSDCAERGRPARLSQPLSFQKGSHYWGHYTQQRRGETTQTVCRLPAELTSHPASKPLISRRFEVGAHRNLRLHGSRCTPLSDRPHLGISMLEEMLMWWNTLQKKTSPYYKQTKYSLMWRWCAGIRLECLQLR